MANQKVTNLKRQAIPFQHKDPTDGQLHFRILRDGEVIVMAAGRISQDLLDKEDSDHIKIEDTTDTIDVGFE